MPALIKVSWLSLGLGLIAPCGNPNPAIGTPAPQTGAERPPTTERTPPMASPPAETEPEPLRAPDPPLAQRPRHVHGRLSPRTVERLRQIAARAELREDVFAKMGGSSIESLAYLHCFGTDRNLDLGGREALRPTVEFFRRGRAGGRRDPFRRQSLAAHKGWSLRHGLTGRPSRIIQELRATRARYALVLFGGNDVQARNPRRFGEQLEKVLESIVGRGVVPVLGSTSPRGDDPMMDVWARRYNRMSHGIARAWALPYIDFYLAQQELPNRGLAGDGVHSNVLLEGGRGRACVFTEEGLERGMNMRNLRTLESLHRLRAVMAGEPPPDPEPEPSVGEGTAASPLRVAYAPFAEHLLAPSLGASLDGYGCEGAGPAPGPERVYRVRVEEPTRLWFSTLARRGTSRVFVLGAEPDPASCVAAGSEVEVELSPGVHHIVAELQPQREDATLTFMLDDAIEPAR